MKIQYRENLAAGIVSILFGIALLVLTPLQIKAESASTYGISSRTIPNALGVLVILCGAGLLIESLVLKKDEVKELAISSELKGAAYMLLLIVYSRTVAMNFVISTMLLGTVTLGFVKCKKPLYYGIVVITVAGIYLIFTQLLHVRLP